MKKLCVCGRSKNFPLCDGSHRAEGWDCAQSVQHNKLGFCAAHRHENLARKLASHYQAILCHAPGDYAVDHLVCIADGSTFGQVERLRHTLSATRTTFFCIDTDSNYFAHLFPNDGAAALHHCQAEQAFMAIQQVIDGEAGLMKRPTHRRQSCFVSHAVADEAWLLPICQYLKEELELDLFLCANSIPIGSRWSQEIMAALKRYEQFVFVMTEHSVKSHFCSFELGAATAQDKSIAVLAADAVAPPSFLQDLQHIDIARLQQQKPWLERSDIVTEQLIEVCHAKVH